MVEVERTFTVHEPTHLVLGYLQDFGHAEEWDPATVSCTRLDAGPVLVGSRWRNVSEFLGQHTELTYQLTRLDDTGVTFTGENRTATTMDDITVVPGESPDVSVITYRAAITMHGAAKVASPLAKVAFEKLANDTVTRLTQVLDGIVQT
jgi:carbon monoxide dehydrogenase subunit G